MASAEPRGRTAALLALVAGSMIVGCEESGNSSGVTRRDSAGIEIVEATLRDSDSLARLGEPVLEIGRVQGPEAHQLHDVRSALRLSAGEIVVANGGTNQLRFYASDGTHLHSTPGTGEGPGEFTGLMGAARISGDSVVAYSRIGDRMSLFAPDGRFVRDLHLSIPDAQALAVRGGFPNGDVIVSGLLGDWSSSALETGLYHGREVWATFDAEGELRDILGRYPWARGALYQYHGQGGWGTQMILTFPGITAFAVAGTRLFIGDGRNPEVRSLTPDGAVERILRWDVRPPRLTGDFVTSFRQWLLSQREDPVWRRRYEEALEALPFPDSLPVFEDLAASPGGELWVEEFSPRHASEPEAWWAFGPDGRFLGRVTMPRGFELTQVGEDFVLGIHTDELDVEWVRLYRPPSLK